MKKISNFLTIYFTLFVLASSNSSLAESTVSNTDIVKQIEKSLIFDKDSRQKIDFYQNQNSNKKSDFSIIAGEQSEQDLKSEVDIVVANPKAQNYDMRQNERLAYNAALIGQYEVAIALYKKIIDAEPDNSYAKFSLAIVYQKIGQFRQAKTLYYEMLKNNPDNQEEIVGNLLSILIEESPRDATYLLSRLSTQNPKSPNILAQAAIAYDKVKNYDQAIYLMEKVVALDPDNLDYKYNLAVIYDKTERYQRALELYSDVAKNYSQNNQSIPLEQVQQRIQSIRNKL